MTGRQPDPLGNRIGSRCLAAIAIVIMVTSLVTCQARPAPSSLPTAPTPAPVAVGDLVAVGDWRAPPDPARFPISLVEQIIPAPGGYVAVGCAAASGPACGLPAVWTSADAVAWSGPTLLPVADDLGETYGMAEAAAITPMGLAIGGRVRRADRTHAALWFSRDSRSFERIADDATFPDAAVVALTTVGDRFVAVGSEAYLEYFGFRAWASDDGRAWVSTVAAGSDVAFPVGVLTLESGLLAWGPTCGVCPPETAWWRSEDGLAWTATSIELGSGRFAYVTAVGEGPAGLVAFGTTGVDPVTPAAWSFPTGADWWSRSNRRPSRKGRPSDTTCSSGTSRC